MNRSFPHMPMPPTNRTKIDSKERGMSLRFEIILMAITVTLSGGASGVHNLSIV
jgi:hypothetical protein